MTDAQYKALTEYLADYHYRRTHVRSERFKFVFALTVCSAALLGTIIAIYCLMP